MAAKKIITVIGATGQQGGAVVDTFLNDPILNKTWTVRAVTRNASKEKTKEYKSQGAEIVIADLDDKESLVKAFTGAAAAFAVTNYWEKMNVDAEIQQGKNIIDAAKESGLPHLIWSSLLNVKKLTEGKLPHVYHFDGKAEVEEYARNVGVPSTFFLAGFYMKNLPGGMLRQNPPDNAWVLALPVPSDAPIPMFDVANTGIWVKAIVNKGDQLLGKRVLGATKYMNPEEIIAEFKRTYPEAGKTATFYRLPHEAFLKAMKEHGMPDFAAEEALENMRLMKEGGYFGFEPLDESLSVLEDKPTTWVDFMKKSPAFKDLK